MRTSDTNHYLSDMGTRLCLVLISVIASLQISFAQTAPDPYMIKGSADYYWGEGMGDKLDEAKKAALAEMINKISVSVSQEVRGRTDVVNINGDITTNTSTTVSMVTKSGLTSLSDLRYIVVSDKAPFVVLCYVDREQVRQLFEKRKNRAFQYIRDANRALDRMKIDDALRQYYWAYALINSLPDPGSVNMDDDASREILVNWLPNQIREIFSEIRAYAVSQKGDEVVVKVTYMDQPVRSFEFTYFDGMQTSPPVKVKDGIAQIDLSPSASPESVKIKYEYKFMPQASIDRELSTLIESSFVDIPDSGGGLSVAIDSLSEAGSPQAVSQVAEIEHPIGISSLILAGSDEYVKAIEKVIAAIRTGSYNTLKPIFTTDGWEMMSRLLKYGKARLIGTPEYQFYRMDGDRVCCRSIRMSFAFPLNNKKFTEDVTFTFNSDKQIECVAFGLGDEARTDIFDRAIGSWGEDVKMILATFLENYKTAYALKRLEYIESIFDDNAIIIVGNVLKSMPKTGDGTWQQEETVTYDRYSKSEYIERLKRVFAKNEFVNINFADNRITKMSGARYAIQLHQDYYSSSYSDTGFLFLIVDFADIEKPSISVRIWQAERDPEHINSFLPKDDPDYGIYSPGEF